MLENECKKLWKNLTDQFRTNYQEVKCQRNGSGLDDVEAVAAAVKWTFVKSLLFLKDVFAQREYLSSGDLVKEIALAFRVGISTASESIRETCRALWTRLQPLYMKKPGTADWQKITESFQRNWQFPNCLGAVDGKHVRIRAPPNSGSMYHHYKDNFSIVLLAVADGDYKFVVVDVGAYGKQSDGGILRQSQFGQKLDAGTLQLPGP
ncbi:uncharacterized protein LOC135377272 [Ornithodoros turicata]|uniref:uncharacterized protein LOC135377272 n=1 Tax=Ornithodoros turicata TaxID=34597 RepID=UPI003138970B